MRLLLIALITCFLTAVSNAELRTWTAVNGKKVKANFVSSSRGIVKLRLESGKVFEIPRDKLSKEDHEFIDDLYKVESVGSGVKKKKTSLSNQRFIIKDDIAILIKGMDGPSHFDVPDTYKGKPVKIIGKEAFERCKNLVSIVLPENLISIEQGAFRDCVNLERIKIPEGVLMISDWAFGNCSNLKSVNLHDGIIKIGKRAFTNTDELEDFIFPKSLTKIDDHAFDYSGLKFKTLNLPNELTEIGIRAFSDCHNIENFIFPETLKKIGEQAFWDYYQPKRQKRDKENPEKTDKVTRTFTFLGNLPIINYAPDLDFSSNYEGVKNVKDRYGPFDKPYRVKKVELRDIRDFLGSGAAKKTEIIEEFHVLLVPSKSKILLKRSSTRWIGKAPDLPFEFID